MQGISEPEGTRRDALPLAERRTYTVEEAGKILGVCRNTAYALAANGRIPTIRLGRRRVVPAAALDRLLTEA